MSKDMCSCIDLMRLWDVTAEKIADLMIESCLTAYYWKGNKKMVDFETNNEPIINKGVINYKIANGISEEVIFDEYVRRTLNHPGSYYSSLTNDQVMAMAQLSKSDSAYGPVYLYGLRNIIRPMLEHLEKDSIAEMARGLYFRVEDINRFAEKNSLPVLDPASFEKIKTQQFQQQIISETENHLSNKEKEVKTINPEAFINSLQVSYSSDTSIWLAPQGGEWQEFTYKDMGFKQDSKTWRLLLDILQDTNHTYCVGPYDKKKNPYNVRAYNKMLKNLENCSKKFVSFLNQTYHVHIPNNFNVFENMKGRAPAGTYKPKFQVVDEPYSIRIAEIEKMSKKEVINNVEILSKQMKQENNTDKKTRLLKKLWPYLEHAKNMKYLSDQEIRDFIILPDEFATNEDAMSYAVPIDGIKNR